LRLIILLNEGLIFFQDAVIIILNRCVLYRRYTEIGGWLRLEITIVLNVHQNQVWGLRDDGNQKIKQNAGVLALYE